MSARRKLVLLLGVFSAVTVSGMAYLLLGPAGGSSPNPYIIEIEKGERPQKISGLLEAQGIVASAERFWLAGKVTGSWKRVKAGEYEVSSSMSTLQILRVLTSGISRSISVTIKEGDNMYQVADHLVARGFSDRAAWLKLFRDKALLAQLGLPSRAVSIEGFLYPETYGFPKRTDPLDIVKTMTAFAKRNWTPAMEAKAKTLGLDWYGTVTLASVIEKETGAPEERPMISSVFHNRLRKKMRLQSDPTTIYGIWEHYTGNLHRSDLTRSTPFNTYTVPALPLGPISNPSALALKAALEPVQSPYLYFVSKNDGTHEFTSAFQDHQRAVARFQLDPKAREGKSWRDLQKRTPQGKKK